MPTDNTTTSPDNPKQLCTAALNRIAEACVNNPGTGQTERLMTCLASFYNGSDYPRVNLQWVTGYLDSNLLQDLAHVLLGCGTYWQGGDEIRDALRRAGGQDAVDRLHSRQNLLVAHRDLKYLVGWAMGSDDKANALFVRDVLRSLCAQFANPKRPRVEVNIANLDGNFSYLDSDARDAFHSVIDGYARGYFSHDTSVSDIVATVNGAEDWLFNQP